ncbi:MBL fold metallo-hydrolase [Marivirga lumbricoides]|uniref:MBL fold metallo-hydrolase n=1 Tax=Marivirga lumbricoides TaxID=1046115 RepID=A0A2T4DPP0_9BACT|nr:MBL fold metallo-hydrolase [Marivirga lumbricoides]
MKKILLILFALITFQINAQDLIKTSAGDVKITPVLHGSLVLEIDGQTIFIDPYGGAEKFSGFSDADLILITDIHGDHLHKSTLEGLNTSEATFIVPKAVAEQMEEIKGKEKKVINNGEKTTFNKIQIEAIPMYNLPEDEQSRHTKGRGNGYILTIGDKKFYLSGDTEDIPEMRNLKNIDVAFICMNLPYTMDIQQAAEATIAFTPSIVYPYHYRGQNGLSDVEEFKSIVEESAKTVEVRLRNWYPEN